MNILPYTRVEHTANYDMHIWYDHMFHLWDGRIVILPENITLGIQGNNLNEVRLDAEEAFYIYNLRATKSWI